MDFKLSRDLNFNTVYYNTILFHNMISSGPGIIAKFKTIRTKYADIVCTPI